ncbi:MAG: hypothetical protein M0Z61_16420 [Nitrospiraceae bacterium]|nr:hypothetical protein [Nitrospiraceae bacterium]
MRKKVRQIALPVLITGLIAGGLVISGYFKSFFQPKTNCERSCCGTTDCRCSPFGGYCKGPGWGWYGADRSVKTPGEAGEAIRKFYLPEEVNVAKIQDKGTFFEAEVKNGNNKGLDMVIIDRRTGRISSIY